MKAAQPPAKRTEVANPPAAALTASKSRSLYDKVGKDQQDRLNKAYEDKSAGSKPPAQDPWWLREGDNTAKKSAFGRKQGKPATLEDDADKAKARVDKEKAAKSKAERDALAQQALAQQARDKAARDKAAKDKAARERQAKAARDKAAKDKAARERQAKAAKDKAARDKAAKAAKAKAAKAKANVDQADRTGAMLKQLDDYRDRQNPAHDIAWIIKGTPNKEISSAANDQYLKQFIRQLESNPARYSKKYKLPSWFEGYFGSSVGSIDKATKKLGIKTSVLRLADTDGSFVFKEAASTVGVSAEHLKRKFYNNPVALIVKLVSESRISGLTPKMKSLTSQISKLIRQNSSRYTKLYFAVHGPSAQEGFSLTSAEPEADVKPTKPAAGVEPVSDPTNPYFDVCARASYYAYKARPANLMGGKWLHKANLSNTRVAVYVSGKEVVVAFKGTDPTNLEDLATDLGAIVVPLGDLLTALSKNSFFARLKRQVDKIIKAYPRARYKYILTGHSLGGHCCFVINRWYALDAEAQGVPYTSMQMATFNAGSGLAALASTIKSMFKVGKKARGSVWTYRIKGDQLSALQNPYGSRHKVFRAPCPTGWHAHAMENFLPESVRGPCPKTKHDPGDL
eukprot:g3716.t1